MGPLDSLFPPESLREALEFSLIANPDDLATHVAYGDHLAELGDPRGEFIQVQIALEDPQRSPAEREQLHAREQQLLTSHQREWIGEAADLFLTSDVRPLAIRFGLVFGYGKFQARFARGWLESLFLNEITPPLAEMLGRSPTIRLLRQLTIRKARADDPGYGTLAEWPALDCVRRLQLGLVDEGCHVSAAGIDGVVAQMKRVEELYLYAHRTPTHQLFALPMRQLRKLHVHHVYEYPLEVLGANPTLGNLVELSCQPHALEPGNEQAYLQLESFHAMCRSPHLKSLTYLVIRLSDVGDEGVRAVIESGLLKRLRVLDLWGGRITDAGARLLADSPDIRHLDKLILGHNALTAEGVALLQATGVNLEADGHFSAEEIEERLHLTEGDLE